MPINNPAELKTLAELTEAFKTSPHVEAKLGYLYSLANNANFRTDPEDTIPFFHEVAESVYNQLVAEPKFFHAHPEMRLLTHSLTQLLRLSKSFFKPEVNQRWSSNKYGSFPEYKFTHNMLTWLADDRLYEKGFSRTKGGNAELVREFLGEYYIARINFLRKRALLAEGLPLTWYDAAILSDNLQVIDNCAWCFKDVKVGERLLFHLRRHAAQLKQERNYPKDGELQFSAYFGPSCNPLWGPAQHWAKFYAKHLAQIGSLDSLVTLVETGN